MTRPEYIDRLVRITLQISAIMDVLPHVLPLDEFDAAKVQGRLLSLKTELDHAAGEEGGAGYAPEFRAAAAETVGLLDTIRWDSVPGRKWYGPLYNTRVALERRLNELVPAKGE